MMDWNVIRNDYVNSDLSLRQLARKYAVSYSTLQSRAAREQWQLLRLGDESIASPVLEQLEVVTRLLLERLQQAAGELHYREILTRSKVKTQDGEVVTERRDYEPGGKVDSKELKILTGALKDIRDVLMVRSALDVREQEAKIRTLERQLGREEGSRVTVALQGELEEFAQ